MNYTAEAVNVVIGGIKYEGAPIDDLIYSNPKRLWFKDVEGKPFAVKATCSDWTVVKVPFTESEYEKHIKNMQPTVESPFKVSVK